MWWKNDNPEAAPRPNRQQALTDYLAAIAKTAKMVEDKSAVALAKRRGLDVLNLTWEDTARYKGSAVGPNISDLTIVVRAPDGAPSGTKSALMPVIRHPNFSDRTADIPLDRLNVLVGNEHGDTPRSISLREYLGDLRAHLHDRESWSGKAKSLLAPRDTHALVSAQACFLPVPKDGGLARFNPVLMNYQSEPDDPAVLAILATREGTSATILDGRDGTDFGSFVWGTPLYFNRDGQRCAFTGQRLAEFVANRKLEKAAEKPAGDNRADEDEKTDGLNVLLLIQVPLEQKPRPKRSGYTGGDEACAACAEEEMEEEEEELSDVDEAALGHGEDEGPFREVGGYAIKRDARFPVRVTVQFYKATSNGVVSERDVAAIAEQVERVYADGDYVGSLVVEGVTARPTEHAGPAREPPDWWTRFWESYERETGRMRMEALRALHEMLGGDWVPRSEDALRAAVERANKGAAKPPVKAVAKVKSEPSVKPKVKATSAGKKPAARGAHTKTRRGG